MTRAGQTMTRRPGNEKGLPGNNKPPDNDTDLDRELVQLVADILD